jgi:hypothetical protein
MRYESMRGVHLGPEDSFQLQLLLVVRLTERMNGAILQELKLELMLGTRPHMTRVSELCKLDGCGD